jgi:hypothetical protein
LAREDANGFAFVPELAVKGSIFTLVPGLDGGGTTNSTKPSYRACDGFFVASFSVSRSRCGKRGNRALTERLPACSLAPEHRAFIDNLEKTLKSIE